MGAVRTIKRGGSRFYVHPDNGKKAPGVTSIINMLPAPYLTYWAAKMTAEAAISNWDVVVRLAESDPVGAVDYLKGAHTRYTKARAEVGSAAHDLFERMIRGETVRRADPDLEPYRRHFADFLDKVQPELLGAEDVAWSDTHDYAGSFDALLLIGYETVICDWKTSKDAYPSVALQLAAYAHADYVITPDGEQHDMPSIDAGAVLHITPERWELKPVDISHRVFEIFLALRKVFDWDRELSKGVLGPAVESGGEIVTGTQRRR